MATDRGARPGCKKATGGSCRGVRWRTGGIARGPAGPYGERPDGTLCHHARSVATSRHGSGRRVDLLDELGEPVLVEMAGQVGLGDDADQPVVVDHRQPLDLVVLHLVQHLADVGGRVDPAQVRTGDLAQDTVFWVRSPVRTWAGSRPSAMHFTAISRSVMMPCSRSSAPQIGSEPTPRSRIFWAAIATVSSAPMHSAPGCMMSRACRAVCGRPDARFPDTAAAYASSAASRLTTASWLPSPECSA